MKKPTANSELSPRPWKVPRRVRNGAPHDAWTKWPENAVVWTGVCAGGQEGMGEGCTLKKNSGATLISVDSRRTSVDRSLLLRPKFMSERANPEIGKNLPQTQHIHALEIQRAPPEVDVSSYLRPFVSSCQRGVGDNLQNRNNKYELNVQMLQQISNRYTKYSYRSVTNSTRAMTMSNNSPQITFVVDHREQHSPMEKLYKNGNGRQSSKRTYVL